MSDDYIATLELLLSCILHQVIYSIKILAHSGIDLLYRRDLVGVNFTIVESSLFWHV